MTFANTHASLWHEFIDGHLLVVHAPQARPRPVGVRVVGRRHAWQVRRILLVGRWPWALGNGRRANFLRIQLPPYRGMNKSREPVPVPEAEEDPIPVLPCLLVRCIRPP